MALLLLLLLLQMCLLLVRFQRVLLLGQTLERKKNRVGLICNRVDSTKMLDMGEGWKIKDMFMHQVATELQVRLFVLRKADCV